MSVEISFFIIVILNTIVSVCFFTLRYGEAKSHLSTWFYQLDSVLKIFIISLTSFSLLILSFNSQNLIKFENGSYSDSFTILLIPILFVSLILFLWSFGISNKNAIELE